MEHSNNLKLQNVALQFIFDCADKCKSFFLGFMKLLAKVFINKTLKKNGEIIPNNNGIKTSATEVLDKRSK